MRILSFIYLLITTIRNFLYDEKILPINRVPNVEVICIGNISVGGTGKTPAVHFSWIQRKKKERPYACQ